MDKLPRVCIGMPMYNAERYLAQAIESELGQTFSDFEIVICDNASEDGTEELCRAFARRDKRIRYYRNSLNIGAGPNHVRVFEMARSEFFKWHSSDDTCESTFLEKCVAALDADPGLVLCHSLTELMDAAANVYGAYERRQPTSSNSAPERFRQMIWYDHMCYQIYGLIRTESIRDCGGMGCYVHGDGVLLARLALRGRFHELPEYLFFNRRHNDQSAAALPERVKTNQRRLFNCVGPQPPAEWWDPKNRDTVTFPYFRMLYEYIAAISEVSLPIRDRAVCLAYVAPWIGKMLPRMLTDLKIAADVIADPLLNKKKSNTDPRRNKPTPAAG
jgi:glycosyltransferase involved in cell wall biosynthesis